MKETSAQRIARWRTEHQMLIDSLALNRVLLDTASQDLSQSERTRCLDLWVKLGDLDIVTRHKS